MFLSVRLVCSQERIIFPDAGSLASSAVGLDLRLPHIPPHHTGGLASQLWFRFYPLLSATFFCGIPAWKRWLDDMAAEAKVRRPSAIEREGI